MEQQELDSLVSTPDDLINKIKAEKSAATDTILTYQKQYDPKLHDVMSKTLRPDKLVEADSGPSAVSVTRLPIPFQKKIVRLAATFLCGNPIELSASPADQKETDFMTVVRKAWKLNKLDYESKRLAKLMMSETEVAELWYTEAIEPGYWKGTVNDKPAVKFRLRMKIIANKYGDSLYPVFNSAGDLIAFGRAYQLKVENKKEDHFDVYTIAKVYKNVKIDGGAWTSISEVNPIGKIPVIYYSQEFPEWNDVQEMIDRIEKVISNHGDTNDYYVSPMVFLEGEIEGFAKKGEQGKVLQGKNGAKASYLTWDQSPESLKLEYNNLRSLIFDMSDTPDISMEQMKALGTYSGIALKMLFLGAHLKASDKEETFGKGIQRRINFIKAALAVINADLEQVAVMNIEPKFEYYLPKNYEETINLLSTATGGQATMSQETAIGLNPLVKDPVVELDRIKQNSLDASLNPPL